MCKAKFRAGAISCKGNAKAERSKFSQEGAN